MDNLIFTSERNVLTVVALLKEHGIKKVVASPGTTNITLVATLQHDPFFEIYSSVDERSAAYIACGMAAESGEPVVLTCTGATASRNYFPGLTEAFYRKLPILAITSTRDESKIGHLHDQVLDRSVQPNDLVVCSVHLQTIKDENDAWDCMVKANKAILALKHHGGGPVHINLTTTYSRDYSVATLPQIRKIERYTLNDALPELTAKRVAIYVGTHSKWTSELTAAVDGFCEANNGVVFIEPCSGYKGKYGVYYSIVANQRIEDTNKKPELLIHIGEVSAFPDYYAGCSEVWRVSEDGMIKDKLKKLTKVFEMPEVKFFSHYGQQATKVGNEYHTACVTAIERVSSKMPDFPLSNIWIAKELHSKIPAGSVLHLGILSTLRAWNYFGVPATVDANCNQGGFGIDGNLSTLLGASLVHPDKLYFGIVGDLSFFYDMNVVGNRHVGNNIRIMLINNGRGNEFRLYTNNGSLFGEETDKYISAAGHYGNQSHLLVKHYAEDLGYEYFSASSKEEFLEKQSRWLTPEITDRPMLFEVFTNTEDENAALYAINHIEMTKKDALKQDVKDILGDKVVSGFKTFFKK